MPKGFVGIVKEVVAEMEVPFEIKDIRHASDPRNAVVKGLLTQAILTQENLKGKKDKEMDEALEG